MCVYTLCLDKSICMFVLADHDEKRTILPVYYIQLAVEIIGPCLVFINSRYQDFRRVGLDIPLSLSF